MSSGLHSTTRVSEGDRGDGLRGVQISAFHSPRRSLWGSGEALRIELPAPWTDHVHLVSEALGSISSDDEVKAPGSGPVAFGALPFDRNSPATMLVPRRIHGNTSDDARFSTHVDSSAGGPASANGPDGRDTIDDGSVNGFRASEPWTLERLPSSIRVTSTRSAEEWCEAVGEATRRIALGEFTKVVLARELSIETDVPLDAARLLATLRALYRNSMCFAVDGFVGASPELLVSRIGEVVRAHPMAGTTPRTGDADVDQGRAAELLGSTKNRAEHQITIDMVHDALLTWCSYIDEEPTPSVVAAGPVQHLATLVEGRLSRPAPPVLDLVAALHPTPAVGGWPREPALAAIAELEQAERGPYAGPVGWMDSDGNGAFAVGVRSVLLQELRATLFAGVGVVADSDPYTELEETRSKAQALLGALVRV